MTWKPDERLAERLPLARVGDRLAIGELGDGDALAGEEEPLGGEVQHDREEALFSSPMQVRDRHAASVERSSAVSRAHQPIFCELLAHGEAGRAALDDEQRDAAVPLAAGAHGAS